MSRVPSGPWVQTASGRAFPLLDPMPDDVEPRDIAAALAKLCRFTGHCQLPYSVAEHCLRVAAQLPADLALYGLLHDAHEAYLGDWSTPLKWAVERLGGGDMLERLEWRIASAIHARFGLPWPLLPEQQAKVKHTDLLLLATERRDLLGLGPPWGLELPEPLPRAIRPMAWASAEAEWLAALSRLRLARDARLAMAS